MKRLILQCFAAFCCLTSAVGQNYYMTSPEGFGANATGGGNSTPVTVTNTTELQAALTAAGSGVILVSGTITFPSMMSVSVTNKTILGLPGAKFVNTVQTAGGSGILALTYGSNNVIIRNLIFEGPGAYDVNGKDNLTSEATNLWVDHCEFQDGLDGNFDLKANADNVTISWCKFTYLKPAKPGGSGGTADHRFSGLVGSSGYDAPVDGHYSVTFQNNYWAEGCRERMPRARNAELHILNCYYYTSISGSVAIGIGGGKNNSTCYVENTDFAKVTYPYKNYNTTDLGVVRIKFVNSPKANPIDSVVAKPSYNYTALPVEEVAAAVANATCGAGATMKISAAGVITTTCEPDGLGNDNSSASFSSAVYPNPSSGLFYIKNNKEIETISMINIVGTEVYRGEHILTDANTEIAANLEKGVYMIKIRYTSGSTETIKFVKN